jgi:hypothetical protein
MEIDLENKFRRWVKKQKGLTYKWTGSREKLDLIVITHTGVVGLLELKNPDGGGKLTPQQAKILAAVRRRTPGVAVCSNDFEECVAWYHMLAKGLFLKFDEEEG